MSVINKSDKIYVAGHRGMVGSAIVRLLLRNGYENLLLKTSQELDLTNNEKVKELFQKEMPDIVILAAARVGGIQANIDHPAEFLFENLQIQNNVIHQAFLSKVKKFCFLGTSCIYPKVCQQPMREEYLLTGPLEPTNEGYALAKIAGLKMVEYYRTQYGFCGISLMPCNLYGTNDSFNPAHSHVLSSLVRKIVDAVDEKKNTVEVWGTGIARREFMHVDDAARAILYFMEKYDSQQFVNIGWGEDISIKELAEMISEIAGFKGKLLWDKTKPDGMLKKCLDVSLMRKNGFMPEIGLNEGIEKTIKEYRSFKSNN